MEQYRGMISLRETIVSILSGASNLITCQYCNGESADESNFCWHCAREIVARPERPAVVQERNDRSLFWGGVIVVVAVILLVLQNL
jgi:hypothetical protein